MRGARRVSRTGVAPGAWRVGRKVHCGAAALAVVLLCMSAVSVQSAEPDSSDSRVRIRAVVKCGGYLDPYLITVSDSSRGTLAIMRGAPGAGFHYGTFTGDVVFAVGAKLIEPSVTAWRIGGPRVFVKTLPHGAAGPPEVLMVDGTLIVAYAGAPEKVGARPKPPAPAAEEPAAPSALGLLGATLPSGVTATYAPASRASDAREAQKTSARRRGGPKGVRFDPANIYGVFDAPVWNYRTLRVLQPDFATGGADATQMNARWALQRRRMPKPPRDGANPWRHTADRRFERLVEVSPGGTLPGPRSGDYVVRIALGSRQILARYALGRNIVKDYRGIAYQVDAYDVRTTALPGVMRPAFNRGWRVPAISTLPYRALYYSSWK